MIERNPPPFIPRCHSLSPTRGRLRKLLKTFSTLINDKTMSKNLKKRSIVETSDQSPPKKQKKQIPKTSPSAIKGEKLETNGDVPAAPVLTAKQRKRQTTKIRKLAAIAIAKEKGGAWKPLYPAKKDKKPKEEGDKPEKPAVKKEKNNESVEAKVKAKQDKRAESTLSIDEIRLRIAEIKGREELTKTAKRKLRIWMKKLAAEEGTAVKNEESKTVKNKEESGLSNSEKRRIRREKQEGGVGKKAEDKEVGDDPSVEKLVDIQSFKKKKPIQKTVVKKIGNGESKVGETQIGGKKNKKQIKKVDEKLAKNKIEEPEIDEDESEDEDEAEDEVDEPEVEEESDDEEEEEEEKDEESSSEQEEEEEEEEEEDDEEEEEEEDSDNAKTEVVVKTVKKDEPKGKGKKEPKQGVKRPLDQEENGSEKKKRYILFVGNLPYDSKPEDVKAHFLTKVGEVLHVRIPTQPGTQQPRGFGYVEVTNDIDYEKGLSLHHTFLSGRRINVEYTLAGSKQVNKRQELVSKNQKLHAMRKAGQLAGSQKHDQKRSVRRFKKREHDREPK